MSDRRILIVDDHPINRRLPAVILQDAGWITTEADSGEQALSRLSENRYDAVLLDISMPGMSGEEVCRRIRAAPQFQSVRIVAYTAHAMEENRREMMDAGFDWILVKPISRRSLLESLDMPELRA